MEICDRLMDHEGVLITFERWSAVDFKFYQKRKAFRKQINLNKLSFTFGDELV